MPVVINEFEVLNGGSEAPAPAGPPPEPTGPTAQKQVMLERMALERRLRQIDARRQRTRAD